MIKNIKKKRKRGETKTAILETIKNTPGITKGALEDIYAHSNVWRNIYSDKGSLGEKLRIEKNSMGVDTYYAIETEGDVDSEYLPFLMNGYKSSSTLRDRAKQLEFLVDIIGVCRERKIRDEKFIKFLIEYSNKREKWGCADGLYGRFDFEHRHGIEFHDDNLFWVCLGYVALKLICDIENNGDTPSKEKSLLKLIRSTGEFFEKIIFNCKRTPSERVLALDIMREIQHPKRYDIAFKLLEEVNIEAGLDCSMSPSLLGYYSLFPRRTQGDNYLNADREPCAYIHKGTELDIFRRQIEFLVFSYAKVNYKECRKRLYSLLDANLGREISSGGDFEGIEFNPREIEMKYEIEYLLGETRTRL